MEVLRCLRGLLVVLLLLHLRLRTRVLPPEPETVRGL
jgi:hypothetical protein